MDVFLALGPLALFAVAFALSRLLTRPASPAPGPATPDLGPESPALVNLLVNRWRPTEDAAEATLLDLAARRFLELRQPADDPMHTTVHLPARPPDDGGLRPYEKQVLERVRGLAVDGMLPLAALTFRDSGQARTWDRRLRDSVRAEARAAGLSRRRFGRRIVSLLVTLAGVATAGVTLATAHYSAQHPQDENPTAGVAIFSFLFLSLLAGLPPGERDTPQGRAVAQRWLGVRAWLRGHEQFGELPPAAVAVWDRYLGYGAALGVTHVASAVIDVGMGDRTLVWSSYGRTWHRMRVRYPSVWPRYGRTTPQHLLRAAGFLVGGCFWLYVTGPPDLDDLDPADLDLGVLIFTGLFVAGALGVLIGAYILARALLDPITERTVTGEVLWIETWQSRKGSDDEPGRPWLHYLAIDDGTGHRTVAWGLPSEFADRVTDGDVVTVRARPWSRRIGALEVVDHGRSRDLTESYSEEDTGNLAVEMLTEHKPPSLDVSALFTADEVGRALGRPVTVDRSLPALFSWVQYVAADGRPVLLVQAAGGLPGRVAWKANRRGQELPGIAGGAYLQRDRAVFRVGDSTVVLTLMGAARGADAFLPWLLAQAGQRL